MAFLPDSPVTGPMENDIFVVHGAEAGQARELIASFAAF